MAGLESRSFAGRAERRVIVGRAGWGGLVWTAGKAEGPVSGRPRWSLPFASQASRAQDARVIQQEVRRQHRQGIELR